MPRIQQIDVAIRSADEPKRIGANMSEELNENEEVDKVANGEESEQETKDASTEKETKTFTQAEVDDIIKKRIERERKKLASNNEKDKTEPEAADKKIDAKMTELESKVLCYDHDIDKSYSKEAIALAKLYVNDDTSLDEAIEKVIEKFPYFKKGAKEEPTNKSWGQKQEKPAEKMDGVTKAFLKMNPDLKI